MNKPYYFRSFSILLVVGLFLAACGNQQASVSEVTGNSPTTIVLVEPTATIVVGSSTSTMESATSAIESITPTAGNTNPLVGEEFTGKVDSITTGSWTVGNYIFSITPGTEIKGLIQIGDQVKVHFVKNGDGTYTATEIEHTN